MEFIQSLLSNPVTSIFTAIMTVAAFILAYRSTPQKVIKCSVLSNKLITNRQSKFNKLNVLYDNKQVEKLTVSDITFWNNSFPPIKKEDLIKKCPFTVSVENGEVLDVIIIEGEDSSNQIEASILDKNIVSISFEYLNRKEGGKIQIIHTGNEDSIIISKKIQGGKIRNDTNFINFAVKDIIPGMLASVIMCIVAFFMSFERSNISIEDLRYSIVLVSILLIIIIVIILKRLAFVPTNCKKRKHTKKQIKE